MTTVKELIKKLSELPEELQDKTMVIYPKYSALNIDGFKKHNFKIENVSKMESKEEGEYVAIIF